MSDPNALLADLRTMAERAWRTDDPAERISLVVGLGEAFTALDELITKQGRLPMDWHRAQLRAARQVRIRADYNTTGPCGSGVPTAQG
jgi:hypothetical protein